MDVIIEHIGSVVRTFSGPEALAKSELAALIGAHQTNPRESMCNLDWSALGSMLSGLAAVFGLGAIAYQLSLAAQANRDQATAALVQAKSRLLEMSHPINDVLIRHPELARFTLIGSRQELPSKGSDDFYRLMLVCEMQANYLEYVIKELSIFEDDERVAWVEYAKDTMNRPAFLVFWEEKCHWYDPELKKFVAES